MLIWCVFPVSCLPDSDKQNPEPASVTSAAVKVDSTPRDALADTLQEIARVGQATGSPANEFGQITAITVDSLARVYVADPLSKDIRVFDLRGRHVRTFGRAGQG